MDIVSEYNKLGFLASILIDICDNLEQTTEARHELKFHLKRANIEAQKVLKKHFELYENHGTVDNFGNEIDAREIYHLTAKAYDFLFYKKPNEIASICEMVKQAEANGIDYTQIDIGFKPIV